MNDKQKLVDICFQIALTVHSNPWFLGKTQEEVTDWVANQLRKNGFDTKPVGASLGILYEN